MPLVSELRRILTASQAEVVVVGAGLAGSECAWQLASRGHSVLLIEQRPLRRSEAHLTDQFAELVCSNSFKSTEAESAPALLKQEMKALGSLILSAAESSSIPAGQALAVDRNVFSAQITQALRKNKKIEILNAEVNHFEELLISGPRGLRPIVFATGPLTHESLAKSWESLLGSGLYFYDAIAPIVDGSTINRDVAFLQNRYDKATQDEQGDYLNCPLSEPEYNAFIEALGKAEKVEPHAFEKAVYFQGCQPIEALLERGPKTLAFGPMKPVGIKDPRNGHQPYAVVQLRKEDAEGRAWNMVGFQTKLKYPEQKKIFRMIPGLENAEFHRLGSLHRNTYIHSPLLLDSNFRLKSHPNIHFAGQITGVEGYLESAANGLLVGRLLSLRLKGMTQPPPPPATTAIGALAHACFDGRVKNFQPMNINWGLIPLLDVSEKDPQKRSKLTSRAMRQLSHWMALFGDASA
jgi:methylenetetrahydrofolate--tRNA-(uracil-5-)-methyltransferase